MTQPLDPKETEADYYRIQNKMKLYGILSESYELGQSFRDLLLSELMQKIGIEAIYNDIKNNNEIEGVRKCCAIIAAHFVIVKNIDNVSSIIGKQPYSLTMSERDIASKAQAMLKEMPEHEANDLFKMGTWLWMKLQDNIRKVDGE